MARAVPCGVPARLTSGDTWEWTQSLADFPVTEGWALSYAFASLSSASQAPLDWDPAWVTDDGQRWTVAIPAEASAALAAGNYGWQAFVTKDGKRYTALEGKTYVEPDLAEATAGTTVDDAEEMLVAVRAEIKARIKGTGSSYQSYQIGTRALALIPLGELRQLMASLQARVDRLRNPGRFGHEILQRYRRASGGRNPNVWDVWP